MPCCMGLAIMPCRVLCFQFAAPGHSQPIEPSEPWSLPSNDCLLCLCGLQDSQGYVHSHACLRKIACWRPSHSNCLYFGYKNLAGSKQRSVNITATVSINKSRDATEAFTSDPDELETARKNLTARVCESPSVDAYAHVDMKCMASSPTATWWKQYLAKGGKQEDLIAHVGESGMEVGERPGRGTLSAVVRVACCFP